MNGKVTADCVRRADEPCPMAMKNGVHRPRKGIYFFTKKYSPKNPAHNPYKKNLQRTKYFLPLQSQTKKKGSLAQLVQSVCLTSRGSGVRLPQLPPPERENQSKILKSGDFGIFCLWPGLQNGGIIDGNVGNVGNVGINGKSMMISGGAPGGQHFGAPPGATFIESR